jgi:ribosomal protein S18 acetylase RimI-like enzyme
MITTRPAIPADVAVIAGIVNRAYSAYLSRMDSEPAPMTDDYAALVGAGRVAVAVDGDSGEVLGAIVRWVVDGDMYVDNIAVEPAAHGRGVGNLLLELAVDEGRQNDCGRVWLYTNAVMTENVGYYERRGFTQYDRRIDAGYDRIFFERRL